MVKVSRVIQICLKASLFAAFRSFGFERRQPSCNLNNQKSAKNPSLSGRRIFTERIFVKIRKIPKGIPIGIFKGFSAVLAKSRLRKPIEVRFIAAWTGWLRTVLFSFGHYIIKPQNCQEAPIAVVDIFRTG